MCRRGCRSHRRRCSWVLLVLALLTFLSLSTLSTNTDDLEIDRMMLGEGETYFFTQAALCNCGA